MGVRGAERGGGAEGGDGIREETGGAAEGEHKNKRMIEKKNWATKRARSEVEKRRVTWKKRQRKRGGGEAGRGEVRRGKESRRVRVGEESKKGK